MMTRTNESGERKPAKTILPQHAYIRGKICDGSSVNEDNCTNNTFLKQSCPK